MRPKLIFKLSAANLVNQVDTTHLRVACYGRIRAKQLERCAIKIKIKIKTLPVLEKMTGGVKKVVVVRAEQGVKVAGGTQMDFGGWGYGGVSVG
jgi:hypothetical protein